MDSKTTGVILLLFVSHTLNPETSQSLFFTKVRSKEALHFEEGLFIFMHEHVTETARLDNSKNTSNSYGFGLSFFYPFIDLLCEAIIAYFGTIFSSLSCKHFELSTWEIGKVSDCD